MKKLFFILATATCFMAQAQQTGFTYRSLEYGAPLSGTPDLRERSPNFDPRLQLVTPAMPMPAGETKQKKLQLDLQRQAFMASGKHSSAFAKKATAPQPVVLKNFIANFTQSTPNDNDIAISNAGKIVSVANTNATFFNDTGGTIAIRQLKVLAARLGNLDRTFDPRVIYDPKQDRFIVVFLQGSTSADTRIILAFSRTNDPMQVWNVYQLPGNIANDSATWSDYPIISLTDEELFITVNRVKDNTPWQTGFVESYIWQVEKQKGYDSAAVLPAKVYSDIKYNNKAIWSICPAKGGLTTGGPNMYFVSVRPSDLMNDTVFIHEITNTRASGNAQLTLKVSRTDKPYGLMPNAWQPGGAQKLQTNDARALSACYEDGTLYYVGNTIDTATFSPSVYFGRITNLSSATPTVTGKILSSDTVDYGYPSIAFAGAGGDDRSVMITYSHVSQTRFPGTSVSYVDRDGHISDPVVVKSGESVINLLTDTVERWGDYTGIQRKYNEPEYLWLNGSFGYQNGNRTWIARVRNTDPKMGIETASPGNAVRTLFPNPASDYVHVDFTLPKTTMVEFHILDLQGREVEGLLRDKGKAGLNRFSFRVNDLTPGTYFLQIRHDDRTVHTQKFVVSR